MLAIFCSWHAQEARPPIHNYRQGNDCGMGVHPVGDSNAQEVPRRWSAWIGIGPTSRPPRDRRRFVELGWMAGRSLEAWDGGPLAGPTAASTVEALSSPLEEQQERMGWSCRWPVEVKKMPPLP